MRLPFSDSGVISGILFFLQASLTLLRMRLRSTAFLNDLLGTDISTLTGAIESSAGNIRYTARRGGWLMVRPPEKSPLMAFMPQSLSPFVSVSFFCLIQKEKASTRTDGCFLLERYPVRIYLLFLLCSLMKQSRAMVIDGAFGLGAWMSSLKPSLVTASAVVGPKAAILTSP